MKNCAYCGRENADDATCCRECGTSEFVAAAQSSPPVREEVERAAAFPDPEPDVSADDESALCTYCLFPNLTDASWCKRCGASIGYGSIVGPVDAARASGFMWRGALRGRPSTFVLVSTWLLFLPKLMLNLAAAWLIFAGGVTGFWALPILWLVIVFGAIACVMLYRVTTNYLTIPKPRWDDSGA